MEEPNQKLSEEDIQKLVEEIRNWLEVELPEARRDDHIILRFLEGCKYRLETAKTKLKNDYNFRKNTAEWYADRDPLQEDINNIISSGISLWLPENDQKGRTIIINRPNVHEAKYSGDEYYKVHIMNLDYIMENNPSMARNGCVIIVDLENSTLKHCLKKMMVMRKMMYWWLNCLPLKIKEVHFINIPFFVYSFIELFKTFLREKMKKRMIVHKKMDELKEYIDPTTLPEEYGGSAGSIKKLVESCTKQIFDKRQWFLENK